jgi:hypothetical protein
MNSVAIDLDEPLGDAVVQSAMRRGESPD